MSAARREALERALWAPGDASVWAVLDGARDPRIHRALVESRLEYRCLYAGRLPRELEMAAPQLVELFPGHRLTQRLLGDGWGLAWGVFLRVSDPANLRHHLRRFLRVQDERGRELLFRFYDPRVLRRFLPTCHADEASRLFGPVTSYLVESEGGTELIEFSARGRGPRSTTLPA